ncbi:hypothetical protein ACVI1J_002255 [Bradyrhizobium diazoefficiens]
MRRNISSEPKAWVISCSPRIFSAGAASKASSTWMVAPAAMKPSRLVMPKVPQNGSMARSEWFCGARLSALATAAACAASVRCECATSFGPLVVPDVV